MDIRTEEMKRVIKLIRQNLALIEESVVEIDREMEKGVCIGTPWYITTIKEHACDLIVCYAELNNESTLVR